MNEKKTITIEYGEEPLGYSLETTSTVTAVNSRPRRVSKENVGVSDVDNYDPLDHINEDGNFLA